MDEAKFGAQIRRARLLEDITQEELARRANITNRTLSKLENGQGTTLGTIIKVLRALGREDWLGTLEPEPTVSPLRLAREAAGISEPQRASRRSR
ncbi:MAG: helix-turn-helix transcriptional regulator [Actinomycetaceae bacterium]|nr:helix-turn-helix transcriptional regulator [Actinomycetaceae bacterium]